MHITTAVLMAIITTAASGGSESQDPALQVAAGANVYFPDGGVVSTWRTARDGRLVDASLHTEDTQCVFQTPISQRGNAGYGWVVNLTAVRDLKGAPENGVMVRVDWRRSRDRMRDVDAPSGSVTLTLFPGKPVVLDYIPPNPDDASRCRAVGMLLDISLRDLRPPR
jgi:hypothetical protein